MSTKTTEKNFILYKIYYGDNIVYVGRTTQRLQDRIRGHLFKLPMHRVLDIELITKIEYATFKTRADMYLYEVYYINLWKPCLNRDDLAKDYLTVSLPDVVWNIFQTPLWEKWKVKIKEIDEKDKALKQKKLDAFQQNSEMRKKLRNGEITENEYWDFWEKNIKPLQK